MRVSWTCESLGHASLMLLDQLLTIVHPPEAGAHEYLFNLDGRVMYAPRGRDEQVNVLFTNYKLLDSSRIVYLIQFSAHSSSQWSRKQ